MEDTEIYPKASKIGFIGRATFQASADHQVFLELVQSEAKSDYVLSPNPQRIRNLPVSLLPEKYRTALSAPGLPSTFSGIRYRMTEAGNRTNQVTSDAQRLVLGATGNVAGWDYDLGLSRAENKAVDKYVNGYVLFDKFDAAVRSGVINPFGPSSKAGQDLINSIKVNDEARKSKGTSTAIDGKVSTSLATLEGGDLGMAIGAEARAASAAPSRRRRCCCRIISPATVIPAWLPAPPPTWWRPTMAAPWPRSTARSTRRSASSWSCRPRCATTITAKSVRP
jgi:iron complex outermembrane receptor protein